MHKKPINLAQSNFAMHSECIDFNETKFLSSVKKKYKLFIKVRFWPLIILILIKSIAFMLNLINKKNHPDSTIRTVLIKL